MSIKCHARRRITLYVVQGRWLHVFPDGLRPFLLPKFHADLPCRTSSNHVCFQRAMIVYLSKGDDGMPHSKSSDRVYIPRAMMALPRPTSSDRVYCPMAMMACHARCFLIVFLYPRAMITCHARYCLIVLCYPSATMACHARRSPIMCAIKRWWSHVTLDVVQPCVQN